MHRHLIAGALACFGSSLFGQAENTTANQAQGTLNNVQNTIQNGLQKTQNTVDRIVPQGLPSSDFTDGQSRTSLQGQASTLGGQQRTGLYQDSTNQNGISGQLNGNAGFQSPTSQRPGQTLQSGQPSNQVLNSGAMQSNGAMQNNGPMHNNGFTQGMAGSPSWNSSQNNNMQSSAASQPSNRTYMLRIDGSGREFICVDGRAVYFDNVNSMSANANSGAQNQYRAGYGNYESKNSQNTQDQSRNAGQPRNDQQTLRTDNSTKTPNGVEASPPNNDPSRSDVQNETKQTKINSEGQLDINAKPGVVNPNQSLNEVTAPKP